MFHFLTVSFSSRVVSEVHIRELVRIKLNKQLECKIIPGIFFVFNIFRISPIAHHATGCFFEDHCIYAVLLTRLIVFFDHANAPDQVDEFDRPQNLKSAFLITNRC